MSLTLPALPYSLDTLEPFIPRKTLAAHHGRHHAAYVEKARHLVQRMSLESAPVEEIVRASSQHQAWNHEFFWKSMRPGDGGEAHGRVAQLIEEEFGSQRAFGQKFITVAGDQFGSGWA